MPKKTWDSNKPIRMKLFLAELAAATGMQYTTMLVQIYDQARPDKRDERFLGLLHWIAGMFNIPDETVDKAVEEAGGVGKVVNLMRTSSTLGLAPSSNHLYVMEDSELDTPAGEYKIGESVFTSSGVFEVQPKSNLSGYVDWAFGIPNFSWIGAFELTEEPEQSALEMAMTEEEWYTFQMSKGHAPAGDQASSNGNMTPLLLAGLGFAVGGPIGAFAGLVLGSMGNGQSTKTETPVQPPETPSFIPRGIGRG